MDNKVGSHKTSTDQLQQLKPEDNLPPQQPTKKSWSRRFVQKIIDGIKWIKDLITFKRDIKITTRKIAKSYIEPIEKKELSNIEFEQIVQKGTFSNEVFYNINGSVTLESIKNLPQHVKIFGNCEIKSSPELKKLSSDFIIAGDVNFHRCSSLKMNADDNQGLFYIHGKLIARNCNSFNFINSEKKISGIKGAITLNNCDSFSYLPAEINNDVNIINCKNFKKLLAGNYQNLKIEHCNRFSTIQSNVVTGDLILNNNNNFTSLPNNLTVKNLSIISCNSLKNIHSSNVKLEGDIIIDCCQQLIKNINKLHSWPRWICSPKSDGLLRSMKILGYYNKIYLPKSVKLVLLNIGNIDHKIFGIESIIESYLHAGNCSGQITYPYISQKLSETDKNNLAVFLRRIALTTDYKFGNREWMSKKVISILTLFQEETDPNIIKKAMKIVRNNYDSGQETILDFDNMLMLVKQKKAQESGDITKIRATIKHQMMIEISDSMARTHGGNIINNRFLSRIKLRELFGLPIGISSRYCYYSNFSFSSEEYLKFKVIFNNEKITTNFIESGDINWLQIEKDLAYYKLPVVYADAQPECRIHGGFYDEMVEYKGYYYSYDAFLKWYKKNGTNPCTKEPIDMSELYRVDYKTVTTDVEDNYIEATETKELTNIEFENLLKRGESSNNVLYVVTGNVNLDYYPYKYLPQHVKILGDFTIKHSLELKYLPHDFTVTGNATIVHCETFRMRDYKQGVLEIQDKLSIERCPSFVDLPATIACNVYISTCKSFRELLPGNYKNLIIKKCENFAQIHPNTVTENLTLINNKKFISFPDNLTVKNLSVTACPIEEFISKITVLKNLLFESCDSLRKIQSPNIKINGNVTVKNCKQLDIHLEIEHFAKLAGYKDATTFSYIDEDLAERDKKHLLAFLRKIRETKDYRSKNKKLLAEQILRILPLFKKETDPTIKKTALEIVEYSVSSCEDRTILALDDLFMLVLQKEAQESEDLTKIRAAMKHNMIIGLADSISRKYRGDQIENILKARLEIRKMFNLPTVVQSMTYGSHAGFRGFSNQDIKKIQKKSTDKELDKFIESGKSNWNEFQKTKIFLPKFEDLPIKPIDKKEMPECCLTNMVYDEMVEYKDEYYGYETLLTIYRNKQKITDRSELVDPTQIHKVVLKKDANT